jgi:asparagine synthase (glutamine-hydrolysing)
MCGIAGLYDTAGRTIDAATLRAMTDAIAHRGPDGEGQFTDGPVGLGHRRLAILDLSDNARQPMHNEDGSVVLIYNGEIYNFRELRAGLEALGHRFCSRTDSEVVVHAYEEWGDRCVERLRGMFAFALWDRTRRRLFIARDRCGIKPLYWYCRNGLFLFGSEIKAILAHPAVSRSMCYEALNEYFTFQNILSDLTLFDGIRLLPAGCTLVIDGERGTPAINRYWDFPVADESAVTSEEDAAERVHDLFVKAVTRQLVSDVPVGAYLSGGMDSGSIASVAVRHLPRLTTFTGGFDLSSASGLELGFDERPSAEMLANLLKTEHYEVVMHAGDMEWVLPQLIWNLEDLRVGQCYPNYYVARLARKFVTVVLSGAGGDELFAGYPWRYYHGMTDGGADDYFQQYYGFWQRLVPDDDKSRLFRDDTSRRLGGHSAFDTFRGVFSGWPGTIRNRRDQVSASLYFEQKTFLHGLLLVEDKLSMAHGLETRVPFLDDDLLEYAARLPVGHKLRNLDEMIRVDENLIGKRHRYDLQSNDGKIVLRNAMQRLIPAATVQRMKQGFSAPDASWFRGESIDYVNGLLRDPNAAMYEYLAPEYVARILDEHCSGAINRRLLIWSFLSFEWWCRQFMQGSLAAPTPATSAQAGRATLDATVPR